MPKENSPGRYERIYSQLDELLIITTDPISRMATLSALLYHKMDHAFWCGFYRLVEKFPGHIACDSRSKSEIVVPVKHKDGQIIAVLDIDSKDLNSFTQVDADHLEKIVSLICRY